MRAMNPRAIASICVFSVAGFCGFAAHGQAFLTKLYPVTVTSDVVYDGGTGLALDVYEPAGTSVPASKPAFLMIHGGGWATGSKEDDAFTGPGGPSDVNTAVAEYAMEFARRGYVCLSIDYRKFGETPAPAATGDLAGLDFAPMAAALSALFMTTVDTVTMQTLMESAVRDAETAYDWLVANAGTYGVDTSRIAVGGYSAGAVTALFVHARGRGASCWTNAGSFGGGAAPGFGGVTNDEAMVAAALGGANPAFNVIAFQGDSDTVLPPATFGDNLLAALVSESAPHEYYEITGENHYFVRSHTVTDLPSKAVPGTVENLIQDYMYGALNLSAVSVPSLPSQDRRGLVLMLAALGFVGLSLSYGRLRRA